MVHIQRSFNRLQELTIRALRSGASAMALLHSSRTIDPLFLCQTQPNRTTLGQCQLVIRPFPILPGERSSPFDDKTRPDPQRQRSRLCASRPDPQ